MAKKITKYTEVYPAFSAITEEVAPFIESANRADIFTMSMVLCDIQMQLSATSMAKNPAPFSEYDVDNYVVCSQCMPSPECVALTQKMVDCILSCGTIELQAKVAYMFYVIISAKI